MADIMTLLSGNGDDLYEELIRENLDQRILVFNDEVNDSVLENYIMYILKWNREDKDLPIEKRQEITIYFNSPGGDTISGFDMVDIIKLSTTPIKGVCFGLAASMGFHLFIACEKRIAFPNSVLLMHDGSIGISNSASKVKDMMKFFDNMDSRAKKHVLECTTMTEEYYDGHYDQELYMYANEKGKELGCVDLIVGEDIELSDIL